jgi:hypothetical protein
MKTIIAAGGALIAAMGLACAQAPSRPATPAHEGYTYPGAWGPTAGTGATDGSQMTDTGTGALAGLALPQTSTGWATSRHIVTGGGAGGGRAATREISIPGRSGTGTTGNITGPRAPTSTGRSSGSIGAPGGGS